MWRPYLNVIAERCSQAIHILDRFHIVAKMNAALNDVRAAEARRLARDGYEPIPRSRENPKILWVDDSEVVRDSVAVGVPIPRHVVAQEGQHCDAEILEAGVALVVGDVPVHQPP